MAITIINLTKSPLTFNLGAPEHRQPVMLQRYDYDRTSGNRYTRRVKTKIGTTLDLGSRESKPNLPDAYEQETEIVNAIKAKKIRIIKIVESNDPTPVETSALADTPQGASHTPPVTETHTRSTRRIAPSIKES